MAIGQTFRLFGPSGVVAFTIETELPTEDGLVMIIGTITEGMEYFVDQGVLVGSQDATGMPVGAWVTPQDLERGTNEPTLAPVNRVGLH
jgi:hypothetical protein